MPKIKAVIIILCALAPRITLAKCGNVDYSWGADALASAHDFVVTNMLYVVSAANQTKRK